MENYMKKSCSAKVIEIIDIRPLGRTFILRKRTKA